MKTAYLYIAFIVLFYSCSSDDSGTNTILEGRIYTLTEFNIEIPVDGNVDGVYSTNLVEEDPYGCFEMNRLSFRDGTSDYLLQYGNEFDVTEDNVQQVNCYVNDFISEGPSYAVSNDGQLVFIGNDEGRIEGNTIVFSFTTENFDTIGRILNQDNTITDYQGSITMIFTLDSQ